MGRDEGSRELALRLEACARALAASEARVRNLIDNHVDGIVIVDRQGVVRFANAAAERLFNRPAAALLGSPFGFPTVAGETTEIDVLRAGGELAVAEVRIVETEWEGAPAFLASLRDITERKRAEEERAQLVREQAARAEAEEASRLKDEFLATVSHELRTPLNVILGWARMLREDSLDPAARSRAVEMIERHAELQARIVDDLLDVSRILSSQLRLDIRPLDPGPLVQAAAESMRLAARSNEIRLEVACDPEAGPVLGDPARLQQVVSNIVSNAVKFTGRGGQVQVRLEKEQDQAVLSVRDTGCGIPPEFLPHVFDRFRQADGSTTRRHGGLGLGLAIARHLVERHGGTIEAESPGVGQGATFRVTLPLAAVRRGDQVAAREGGASLAGRSPSDAAVLDGLSVLIVDDEPDTRELVAAILARRGAEVTAAGTAAEALRRLGQRRYDVLVSDLGMPGADGYALIREARSLPGADGGAGLPAIALTAYAGSEERARALAAGFRFHVSKPVEPEDLVATVAEAAAEGRPGRR